MMEVTFMTERKKTINPTGLTTAEAIRQERIDSEKEKECSSRDFESLVGTYVFAAHRDGGHLFFAG
jgi:hypothetical protein